MLSSPRRYCVLLLLCATVALPLRSEEVPSTKQSSTKKMNGADKKGAPAASATAEKKKPIDLKKMDLPADAVIVICEQAAEALDLVPRAVILTPDKYQAMRDEIEELKKQLQTRKPATPTQCILKGKIEAGVVRWKAEFAGKTDRANTVVALACPQAKASAAQTNGHLALIRRSETDDFLVRIEEAGEYSVQLDLIVPLAAQEGNRRGFELTLPRAVITQLELDLPANSKDVRVGGRPLDEPRLHGLTLKNQHLSGNPGLGPVDKLNLSWKEARNSTGDPVRVAEGRIQVRVDAAGLTTEAELVLKVEGAPTDVWRLLVPLNAEIKVLSPDDGRVKLPLESTDRKFASLRTIHLKERSADPLHLRIKAPLTPRSGSAMPVGPFFVLDAVRQTGAVVVRNPVRNLHLDYRGHGDMQLRRQETEEGIGAAPATVATFEYSNIPLLEKPKEASGSNSLSWLDVEARMLRPQVRTRVAHTLTLSHPPLSPSDDRRESGPTEWYWTIVTTITPAAKKWSELDQLKIFVPPEWRPLDENLSVTGSGASRYVTIPSSLLRESPAQPLRLEGRFEASYRAEGRSALKLPRPQGILESCEVKLEAPAEVEVVLNNAESANLELSKQPRSNEQAWHYRGLLASGLEIDVSWRPYRPDLRVRSVVDLTLHGNRGDVRQEIWLQLPATPPSSLILRVPPAARDRLQIEGESAQDLRDVGTSPDGLLRLPITAKAGTTEWRRVLHYTTRLGETDRLPRAGAPFAVPLAAPRQPAAGDIRVRVWSKPGLVPRPVADPHWEERGIEEVKSRDLPVLVLQATKFDAPLRLVLSEQAEGFSALIEAALVRVQLLEDGSQSWRASFQLRRLADRDLDIRLPGPVATLNAQFLFNGHKLTPEIVNDEGKPTDAGNIAHLRLSPEPVRQTALLDVSFQSPPSRSGRSPLHTLLQPPHILGAPTVPTRWQVSIPANRILIAPESASGVERIWSWRGWLPTARLQLSAADLQREFDKSLPEELHRKGPQLDNETRMVPALIFWQDHTMPILLTHAPQQAWLLVCSLGVLILGLGLYWSARPGVAPGGRWAVWLWPLLAVLILAIAIAALFWPTSLWAIVYGCEPGLLVLLTAIGLQWLLHERYRRQIVFLPSFSRSRAGSSLIRKNSSARPHSGEPSTVDAPPPSMG